MSDDEYEIPLQDQRVFGAGLKRQRVRFVPSSTSSAAPASTKPPSQSAADLYLSLVLPTAKRPADEEQTQQVTPSETVPLCEVCSLPLAEPLEDTEGGAKSQRRHQTSLAHQVCLPHSHPPSHLDRSRKGLQFLQSQGWNPDSRKGLGADGQGILYPVKTRPKDDKLGIGVVLPADAGSQVTSRKRVRTVDAGQVRKLEESDRRRRERLQKMFYENDDVERYLGSGR